ncbi:uncharacterized protein [Spinacia oleracea]|uniref:Transposase-associated domain-containing protein n=1 Tax=Spinacia oleracea TaxID=3562 RepID=A0ABM3R3S6_SPIOL|nr:uncharacterized protein LOC110780427 [Spinacia oleracea]
MDRSWISNSKPGDPQYEAGIRDFVNFAVQNAGDRSRLPCPCFKCHNFLYRRIDEILGHLSKNAFDRTYTRWVWHGENFEGTRTSDSGNDVHDVHERPDVNDIPNANEGDRLGDMIRAAQDKFAENPATFEGVLKDSETPYIQVAASHGLTDQCFDEVLEVFKDMLPDDNVLASGACEAKKILIPMGLPYEKIHACPNDCVLYQNERESLKNCPVCNASRYKEKVGVPAKVLWYFPIVPKFKRLFSNADDAQKLTWHFYGRDKDGLLRHLADSPQWRFIDGKYPEFRKEKRNLRLALSTDGMNPFGSLSSMHSACPVILVTYNLPPSLCMKRKYMMLTLLIFGPKQPGNDIDVYLAPLIDDLKILWEKGVKVFDAHQNETFNLRAMLFCTIQDFPAYGNLSGYTVKGKTACPICEDRIKGKWLKNSKKIERWLKL